MLFNLPNQRLGGEQGGLRNVQAFRLLGAVRPARQKHLRGRQKEKSGKSEIKQRTKQKHKGETEHNERNGLGLVSRDM